MTVLASLNAHHWHRKLQSGFSLFSAGMDNMSQEDLCTFGAPEQEGGAYIAFHVSQMPMWSPIMPRTS